MKIQFTPKRVRLVRVVIALVAISLAGYVAYAATQLSVGPNSGTIVLATKNWQGVSFNPGATGFPASAAACPATGYSDTPSAIAFGNNIPQGTTVTGAVCVKNVSTGGQTYTAATSASPTLPAGTTVTYSADGGTATSGSIPPSGISLLTITLTAGQTIGSVSFTTIVT